MHELAYTNPFFSIFFFYFNKNCEFRTIFDKVHNFCLLSHKKFLIPIITEYWIDENLFTFYLLLIHFDFFGWYRCALPFCKWINTTDSVYLLSIKPYLFLCTLNIKGRDEMYPNYIRIGENVKNSRQPCYFPLHMFKENIPIGLINKKFNN